jgi:N-acetyl-alpha-D-glucosaminyl L-malate synthase BshA
VEVPSYPLFREPQYLLALTNTIVRVSRRHRLDLLHAHYAVPHATAAYLAQRILSTDRERPPRTVTTLHGTDITLVGSDPSYASVVGFSIEASDGVTAVSESLGRDTASALGVRRDVRVIPNFLDCRTWTRRPDPDLRARLCPPECQAVVMHVSNFRPVKRVDVVLEIFRRIRLRLRARLVMIGDGPDRLGLERRTQESGLADDVEFVTDQQDLVPWLSAADLFLLPSSQESFGLAALEAMSCGVPVVASRTGGVPEVIADGVTGVLRDPDDVDGMSEAAIALLTHEGRRRDIGTAAALDVQRRFSEDIIVPQYEQYYEEVLARRTVTLT